MKPRLLHGRIPSANNVTSGYSRAWRPPDVLLLLFMMSFNRGDVSQDERSKDDRPENFPGASPVRLTDLFPRVPCLLMVARTFR